MLTKSASSPQADRQTDRQNTAVTSSSFHGNSEVKPRRLWLAAELGQVVPCRRVWRGSPGHWCHQRYWNQDQDSSLFSHTTKEEERRRTEKRKKVKYRRMEKQLSKRRVNEHVEECRVTHFGSYLEAFISLAGATGPQISLSVPLCLPQWEQSHVRKIKILGKLGLFGVVQMTSCLHLNCSSNLPPVK